MIPKTYCIDNLNFRLKADLTLDEAGDVEELFKNLFVQCEQVEGQNGLVTGSFSNSEIKKFLSIALEPVSSSDKQEGSFYDGFDFGKAKESVAVEVIKDFFLYRIRRYQDFTLSYVESIKQR
jgi:hypothetical protein